MILIEMGFLNWKCLFLGLILVVVSFRNGLVEASRSFSIFPLKLQKGNIYICIYILRRRKRWWRRSPNLEGKKRRRRSRNLKKKGGAGGDEKDLRKRKGWVGFEEGGRDGINFEEDGDDRIGWGRRERGGAGRGEIF